jgi:hypothetical protein
VALQEAIVKNDDPPGIPNQTWSFGGTKTVTTSQEFSTSHTVAGGGSLTVGLKSEFKAPLFGKVEGPVELEGQLRN